MKILVINCGSSSIKYKLFRMPGSEMLARGIIEKIGLEHSEIRFYNHEGDELSSDEPVTDHQAGIKYILDTLTNKQCGCLHDLSDLDAVGHRVTHGGNRFRKSMLIDEGVFNEIARFAELAPLHNPHNLKGIEAMQNAVPGIIQVAVFDTAFHKTIPEYAFMYAIPYYLYEKYGIRRYGFHGTSHYYVAIRACEILNVNIHQQKIITCHLGNGSSVAAIKEGKSIDTSMGFTPAEGLIMGTRPGDLDVSILPYIMKKEGMECEEVNTLMNEKSGMLGISGISSDIREIEKVIRETGDARARLSMEMFFYRIRKYIGAYAAIMNGLDILVLTGGIGENCHEISTGLCHELDFLGIELKPEQETHPNSTERILSSEHSRVKVMVIPTNEELVIAQESWKVIFEN